MTRRVVLGTYNDGVTMGLRVSAPGIDALTGSSAGGDFTFDSEWSDISKIHQVGLAVFPSPYNSTNANLVVSWTSLGYRPFIEVRRYDGNVVRDDWFSSTLASGGYFVLNTVNSFQAANSAANVGITVLYIVYAIPVPSG